MHGIDLDVGLTCASRPITVLTIYICRHAKSSWNDASLPDFDRPLNERGLRDAPFMAKVFRQRGEQVDLVVSSTARRAMSTALTFAHELGVAEDAILRMDRIYHATVPTLLATLNALPTDAKRAMLFGHNPGLTELIAYLTGEDIGHLPTCGMARIDFPGDAWNWVSRDSGTLVWLDHPKRHPELTR